jgi:hypothetical protein
MANTVIDPLATPITDPWNCIPDYHVADDPFKLLAPKLPPWSVMSHLGPLRHRNGRQMIDREA